VTAVTNATERDLYCWYDRPSLEGVASGYWTRSVTSVSGHQPLRFNSAALRGSLTKVIVDAPKN